MIKLGSYYKIPSLTMLFYSKKRNNNNNDLDNDTTVKEFYCERIYKVIILAE